MRRIGQFVAQFFPLGLLLLGACSLLNDFDGYRYESQAKPDASDPRKPPRDAGLIDVIDAEGPAPSQDGALALEDAGDEEEPAPPLDAAQGAREAGSDASDAPPTPEGLEGAWEVSLPRRSSTCDPPPAVLELDGWQLEVRTPTAGVLRAGWGTLEGTLQSEGGRVVAASFGGDIDGAHYTIELWLGARGALAGQLTEEPLGAGRCVTTRAVEGIR